MFAGSALAQPIVGGSITGAAPSLCSFSGT
jgi:hypothetical protein